MFEVGDRVRAVRKFQAGVLEGEYGRSSMYGKQVPAFIGTITNQTDTHAKEKSLGVMAGMFPKRLLN